METFSTVRVGCLATVDPDGAPRSTPLHFILNDNQLIWLSSESAQHSQNIARDGRIDFAIWDSPAHATRVKGRARLAKEHEIAACERLYRAKLGSSPELPGAVYYIAERDQ